MTKRTVGSFAIPAVGQTFEQRAARLYKLCHRLLPDRLLLKLCVALYEAGVFFLQAFHVFSKKLELGMQKGEVFLEDD